MNERVGSVKWIKSVIEKVTDISCYCDDIFIANKPYNL